MHRDVPGQKLLFKTGEPVRRAPTQDEIYEALKYGARLAVGKWHKGRPPDICDNSWDVLKNMVIEGAYKRMKNFQHGGKFKIEEYAYMACCFELIDIQRKSMRYHKKPRVDGVPLLDYLDAIIA